MYLTQGLHRSLQRHPGKLALLHLADTGPVALDFAALVQQVAQLAAALQANGVVAGDRVALLSPGSPALVQQLLACWWLGAVACPLNPRSSPADLHAAMADSAASLLVVDLGLMPLSARAGLASALKAGATELDGHSLAAQAAQRLPLADSRTGGDALAAVLYTSGATGRPKGVMLSHANFCAAALARAAALRQPGDALLLLAPPLSHVAGVSWLVGQLMAGDACLTLPQARPDTLLAAIAGHAVTGLLLVPSLLQGLLDQPGFDPRPLQGLRRVYSGGAPMPQGLLRRAQAAWPAADFVLAYGMTETAANVCLQPLAGPAADDAGAASGHAMAVGQAGLLAELRIVDEQGVDRPAGQLGEVLVRGPMVMQGYWRQPEASAQALQGGWLHTGDAGHVDEAGYLVIADRIADIIHSGGERVYSVEVEAVLRLHPAVADVAVVGLPHPVWGQAVHAVVVLAAAALPQPDALRRFCRKRLAGYKCPRSVSFVQRLPLSATGKVQKAQLRASLQDEWAAAP